MSESELKKSEIEEDDTEQQPIQGSEDAAPLIPTPSTDPKRSAFARKLDAFGKELNKIGTDIKRSIVNEETEAGLYEFSSVLGQFTKEVGLSFGDTTTGLLLLFTYHKTKMPRTNIEAPPEVLREALAYWEFAAACFGWALKYGLSDGSSKGMIQGFKKSNATSVQVLLERTKIKKEDILTCVWSTRGYCPGHYVVISHALKSIVIAVRGTFSIRDCLTDLVAKYEPFLDKGKTHLGILRASNAVLEKITPIVLAAHEKYPDYRIVTTGHSLGAGAAAVIAFLLDHNHPELKVHSYAFAPPPVLSEEFLKDEAWNAKQKDLVTSFVNRDDIVPRISYGSLMDCANYMKALLNSTNNSVSSRMFYWLTAGNVLGTDLTKSIASLLAINKPTLDTQNLDFPRAEKLYAPGTLYHFFKHDKQTQLQQIEQQHVNSIVISPHMWADHLPTRYETSLHKVCAEKGITVDLAHTPTGVLVSTE